MSKIFAKCKLCNAPKFLNYLGLCKKCAGSPESKKIMTQFKEHEKEDEMYEKSMKTHQSQDAKELQALEEKKDLTPEEKERLMELKPGITSMAELEKYLDELHNPKPAEPEKEEKSNSKTKE